MSDGRLTRKPRLLVLSQNLPFPPDGGVKIRTLNVLRQLTRTFEVTALCFNRQKGTGEMDLAERYEHVSRICTTTTFPIPQEQSRARWMWDHLRSVLKQRVYTVFVYESRQFRDELAFLLRSGSFDLVHVDSLDLSGYLGDVTAMPIVCTHHNVESSLLRLRASKEDQVLKRLYISHQGRLMEREEKRWCSRVTLNVVVSEIDRERLATKVPSARIEVIPNGVDVSFFKPSEGVQNAIVFVGGLSWFPNRDALSFFAKEVLPLIRLRGVGARVYWVGDAPSHLQGPLTEADGIELVGYVEDIRPYLARAGCYIVPLRVGGGTRLKILDAWAGGKAVVSTPVGCEGLAAVDGENIVIRDDAEGFARAVCDVIANPALQARLGEAGRRTAETMYSWDVIGDRMNRVYLKLAMGKRA